MKNITDTLFKFFFDGKRSNVMLALIVIIAAIVLCSLINANPEILRQMYCTANEAQAIECAVKGWY